MLNTRLAALLWLALPGAALALFGPAVRLDQENRPGYACYRVDLACGPEVGGIPVVYAAFEDDSVPFTIERSDIAFQRSTDLGQTWLPENVIVHTGARFACYPDLQVGSDGTVYLVYTDRVDGSRGHIHSRRSTDGGLTWSAPVQVDDNGGRVPVGWARLALDSAGNLFCTWTDQRGSYLRVYSDVSTDGGASWNTDVRVDDDTVSFNCYPPDCFVQPGTNHYLVTAVAPVRGPTGIVLHSHFYRSTDMGQTFSPGFQLDTFDGYSQQPHVVADSHHVITDYGGDGYGNQCVTMARTLFTPADTWGPQVMVTELDTIYSSFTNGGKLAIDQQGYVHTGLMIADRQTTVWGIYYAYSADHGLTWSEREEVSDLPLVQQWDPSIAVSDAGAAFVAWQDMRSGKAEIWFATNYPLGIEESPKPRAPCFRLSAEPSIFSRTTAIRLSLGHSTTGPPDHFGVSVFDASGRLVRSFPAASCKLSAVGSLVWDGRDASGARCPAGLYVLRYGPATAKVTLLPAE
jgi:hypothetical protein